MKAGRDLLLARLAEIYRRKNNSLYILMWQIIMTGSYHNRRAGSNVALDISPVTGGQLTTIMRAFVIKKLSHPSKISLSIDIPEPQPDQRQVIVDVYSAGLNFFDV